MSMIIYTKNISLREKNNRHKLIEEYYKNRKDKLIFLGDDIWERISHRVRIIYENKIIWITSNLGFKSVERINVSKDVETYKMTNQQLKELENSVKALPDTVNTNKNYNYNLVQNQNFSSLVITLYDMHKKPLQSETIIISGRKYKKSFKGISNSDGSAQFILNDQPERPLSRQTRITKGPRG